MSGFIAVHAGAGHHSHERGQEFKNACKDACLEGSEVITAGGTALEAVTAATRSLENSPITNAGFGSNLTWTGDVECDASVMDGSTLLWGGVGAVSGILNPVDVARTICDRQRERELIMGRIPPCLLVGMGAQSWAAKAGISVVDQNSLISDKSKESYKRSKLKLSKFQDKPVKMLSPLDTVGAVCMDNFGHVAASCSSGGIVLKHPGRVGQAALYGCGCWAQDGTETSKSVATCTSGCGEHLIYTMLARDAALAMHSGSSAVDSLHNTLEKNFLESPFLKDVDSPLGGIIALQGDPQSGCGEFLWAHTSLSLCIGYLSCRDGVVQTRISRLPAGMLPGTKVVVEGVSFRLPNSQLSDPEEDSPP